MSLIATGVALKHRVDVQRDQNLNTSDSWGGQQNPDWQPHLTDLPCRAWMSVASQPAEQDKIVIIEDRRIAVKLGTDILETDQIAQVADQHGTVIFGGPMRIVAVVAYTEHLEVMVEQAR